MNEILANISILDNIVIIVFCYLIGIVGICSASSYKVLTNIFLDLTFIGLILLGSVSVGLLLIRLHNLNVLHLNILN